MSEHETREPKDVGSRLPLLVTSAPVVGAIFGFAIGAFLGFLLLENRGGVRSHSGQYALAGCAMFGMFTGVVLFPIIVALLVRRIRK